MICVFATYDLYGMVVGSGLSSNFDAVALADDIEQIGFMLENPPPEFAAKIFTWSIAA